MAPLQVFTTVHPGQSELAILMYIGESHVASRNRLLGQFHLVGLPPAPVGVPQIEVRDTDCLSRIQQSRSRRLLRAGGHDQATLPWPVAVHSTWAAALLHAARGESHTSCWLADIACCAAACTTPMPACSSSRARYERILVPALACDAHCPVHAPAR